MPRMARSYWPVKQEPEAYFRGTTSSGKAKPTGMGCAITRRGTIMPIAEAEFRRILELGETKLH
ncbi:uncharacterized protein METZ01_LOCUS227551 [marine metagenome]|uniref:Uncharacterized protein n=1 Tax=marine metagenome TaxID=408172 RepID=A0A382GJ87_9ZZZZ